MPYSLKNIFTHTPAQIAVAVVAGLNFAVVMEWVTMTDKQVASANTALLALLGLFLAGTTVPAGDVKEQVEIGKYVGAVEHQALANYASAVEAQRVAVLPPPPKMRRPPVAAKKTTRKRR